MTETPASVDARTLTPNGAETPDAETPDAETPAPDAETPAPDAETPDVESDEAGRLRREAATYRKRLRETEATVDSLRVQIAGWQQQEAARLAAAAGLADGADLFRAGVQLDTLLDDAGLVDPAAVSAAVETVKSGHPHWAARRPADRPGIRRPVETLLGGASTGGDVPSWQGVLRGS